MALFLCFKWKSIWHPFSVGHNGLCKYHKSFCCKIIHRMLIWKMIHLLSLVFIGTTVQQFHIVWHFKPPWHHQTNKQFSSFSSAICSLQSLYLSFSMRNAKCYQCCCSFSLSLGHICVLWWQFNALFTWTNSPTHI